MVREGSPRNTAARTSSNGINDGKLYEGGGAFLIFGQEVFSSIATSSDVPEALAALMHDRNFWIAVTSPASSSALADVMLMMTGLVGKAPSGVRVVRRV